MVAPAKDSNGEGAEARLPGGSGFAVRGYTALLIAGMLVLAIIFGYFGLEALKVFRESANNGPVIIDEIKKSTRINELIHKSGNSAIWSNARATLALACIQATPIGKREQHQTASDLRALLNECPALFRELQKIERLEENGNGNGSN